MPPKAKTPARPVDVGRLVVRGLTDEDHRRLDALTAAAQADLERAHPGATVSRNAVLLKIIREALDAHERGAK